MLVLGHGGGMAGVDPVEGVLEYCSGIKRASGSLCGCSSRDAMRRQKSF